MRHLIVGDTHGHIDILENLLFEAGVTNATGDRVDQDIIVIHIGDFIDGSKNNRTGDDMSIAFVKRVFDFAVIGNHEFPFMHGPAFQGFKYREEVSDTLLDMWATGLLAPSYAIHDLDLLLTHAGVVAHPDIERTMKRMSITEASQMDAHLHDVFKAHLEHPPHVSMYGEVFGGNPLLTNVAYYRGGPDQYGSILWADEAEPKSDAFNQMYGHTPQINGPVKTDFKNGRIAINIDIGGKEGKWGMAMLIDDEGNMDSVTYVRPDAKEALESAFAAEAAADDERERLDDLNKLVDEWEEV